MIGKFLNIYLRKSAHFSPLTEKIKSTQYLTRNFSQYINTILWFVCQKLNVMITGPTRSSVTHEMCGSISTSYNLNGLITSGIYSGLNIRLCSECSFLFSEMWISHSNLILRSLLIGPVNENWLCFESAGLSYILGKHSVFIKLRHCTGRVADFSYICSLCWI